MSPMPRLGRKTSTLILTLLVLLAASLTVFAPAFAQGNETAGGDEAGAAPGEGGIPRKITIRAQDEGCPEGKNPCWDLAAIPLVGGDTVEVTIDLSPSAQPHNFHVPAPIDQATATEMGTVQTMTFTVPDNFERLNYVCDVHPTTMVGAFLRPDLLGSAAEGEEVVEMGVHFLAYWVGVIAFAILFVVYGITFFLFKYNETPATTDHMDRSTSEGGKRMEARNAVIFAVIIAAVAIALIVWSIQRNAHTG